MLRRRLDRSQNSSIFRLAFSGVHIVMRSIRTRHRMIEGFIIASSCVLIPNLVLSARPAESNVNIIERM